MLQACGAHVLEILGAQCGRVEGLDSETLKVLDGPWPQLEHVESRELRACLDDEHLMA